MHIDDDELLKPSMKPFYLNDYGNGSFLKRAALDFSIFMTGHSVPTQALHRNATSEAESLV